MCVLRLHTQCEQGRTLLAQAEQAARAARHVQRAIQQRLVADAALEAQLCAPRCELDEHAAGRHA